MNKQMDVLNGLIRAARRGDQAADRALRTVCRLTADKATPGDVVRIAEFIHDLRTDAAKDYIQSN